MKAGDKIKVDTGWSGIYSDWQEFTVEEFRFCLGVFLSEEARTAGKFTPLCDMYTTGPDTELKYLSNYGEYRTNLVPAWADIPSHNTHDKGE